MISIWHLLGTNTIEYLPEPGPLEILQHKKEQIRYSLNSPKGAEEK